MPLRFLKADSVSMRMSISRFRIFTVFLNIFKILTKHILNIVSVFIENGQIKHTLIYSIQYKF